jgi:hypothetical protein
MRHVCRDFVQNKFALTVIGSFEFVLRPHRDLHNGEFNGMKGSTSQRLCQLKLENVVQNI